LRGYDALKIASLSAPDQINNPKFYKNLQYLGFEFNGQNIFIRQASLSRYFRKMKARVRRSIIMWKSKRRKSPELFMQQILHRYTHLGKRNFLTYAYNSSKKYYVNSLGKRREGMDSPAIRRQIARHFEILENEITKRSKKKRK
jgi:RNA-directed DNA polymerase